MATRLLRRILSWLAIALVAGCAAAFTWLALTSVIDKNSSLAAQIFLVVVGLAACVASLAVSRDMPIRGMPWRDWLAPKPIAALFLAVVAGFGAMTLTLPLFEPRTAVESTPGAIESKIDALQPEKAKPPRILQKIEGLWGEPGCAVAYRFTLKDKALIVDGERRPPGELAWTLVATITSAQADVINVVGEQPAKAKGSAAAFTYITNGVIERLVWDDQGSEAPLELDRC